MRLIHLLFFLLVVSTNAVAQESEFWGDLNLYKNLNKKFTAYGDVGARAGISNQNYAGFYIRPSVSYKLAKFIQLNGGVAWFHTNSKGIQTNEFRGWQGYRLETKVLKRVLLSCFIRLEERWIYSMDQRDFLLRARCLGGATFLLNNTSLTAKTAYIPVAFEIFEDANDHQALINRARTYVGLGYVLNSRNRVEVFYIANGARSTNVESFEVVNVIRLRWHFTFPEKLTLD